MALFITVAAVVLALVGAGGYALYRYAIVRRKTRPPSPERANPVRLPYVLRYAAQLRWLQQWGWEDVSIRSRDGTPLAGYFFRAKTPTAKTALAVHGYRVTGGFQEYLFFAPMYLEQLGMNLLIVDDYAHGASGGKRIGFGWNDRWDCIAWARWLAQRTGPGCEILLQGVSMGAATVLMAAGEAALPPQVRWVVADCGYTGLGEQMRHVMRRSFHVPPFPLYHIGSLFCRALAGYFFGQANTLAQARKAALPALILHGEDDAFVPAEMGRRLYEAWAGPKTLRIVPGAGHAESFLVDPEGYRAAVEALMGTD